MGGVARRIGATRASGFTGSSGALGERKSRAAGTVTDRVEALVQQVPGHELADIRFERRTAIGPRSARALVIVVAVLVTVVGGGMLIGQVIGGRDDVGVVIGEGIPSNVTGALLSAATTSAVPSASTAPALPGGPVESAVVAGELSGESGRPADEATVVVAVQGMVESPGLRTVPATMRVGELLSLVGGARPEARLESVNLAEKVVDGLQLVVDAQGSKLLQPGQGSPGGKPAGASADLVAGNAAKVNINTADLTQLCTLPGVGQKTAEAIISWRETHGAFVSPEQLMEVKGIGDAKYEELRDSIGV